MSWVDDLLVTREEEAVQSACTTMNRMFECENFGEVLEYVGCNVEHNKNSIKLTNQGAYSKLHQQI